jgi:hypothetical protein
VAIASQGNGPVIKKCGTTFLYGVPTGAWPDSAQIELRSADGSDVRTVPISSGNASGGYTVLTFDSLVTGQLYQATIKTDDGGAYVVFSQADLCSFIDPTSPVDFLPPAVDPAEDSDDGSDDVGPDSTAPDLTQPFPDAPTDCQWGDAGAASS